MVRGGKSLLCSGALLLAACAGTSDLGVRAVADPLTAAALKSGNPMIVEARNLLALGSVGLALEAFRKAAREQPDSIDAIAGMAECYDRMGRYDLARQKYEQALAIAPRNAVLLNTFAAALERHGLRSEAAAVRKEAAIADMADVAALAGEIPAPVPIAAVAPPPRVAATPIMELPAPVPKTQWTIERPQAAPAEPSAEPVGRPALSSSVTVALPRPKPANPPRAAERAKAAAAAAALPTAAQPRLERLSLAEVALVTSGGPVWKTETVAQSRHSVTVRFVPLKSATAARATIRLLNAARREGLAARTREMLLDRGWKRIAIGDAPQVRASSVVLYPADRQVLGRRLAAQFGFRSAMSGRGNELVVLLGRDAATIGRLHG